MPQGLEGELLPGNRGERRVGHDRRQALQIRVARFLGAAAGAQAGAVEIQGVSEIGEPIEIVVPVESAMTLLNALHRLSTEDRWFDVV